MSQYTAHCLLYSIAGIADRRNVQRVLTQYIFFVASKNYCACFAYPAWQNWISHNAHTLPLQASPSEVRTVGPGFQHLNQEFYFPELNDKEKFLVPPSGHNTTNEEYQKRLLFLHSTSIFHR